MSLSRRSSVLVLAFVVLLAGFAKYGPSRVSAAAAAAPAYRYAIVVVNEQGELNFETGQAPLTVQGLANALATFPAQGWEVFSVLPYPTSSSFQGTGSGTTSFVVILRR